MLVGIINVKMKQNALKMIFNINVNVKTKATMESIAKTVTFIFTSLF
jgi:hypothetical protein